MARISIALRDHLVLQRDKRMRERERERERETDRERQTERDRQRETDRERERDENFSLVIRTHVSRVGTFEGLSYRLSHSAAANLQTS